MSEQTTLQRMVFNVLFVVGQKVPKSRLRGVPLSTPRQPSASESNCHGCAMGNPKARTEAFVRSSLAFAASKRTAKTEKLTNVGSKDFLVLFG